jgi:DNA-binding IclR family transcriptional regulator
MSNNPGGLRSVERAIRVLEVLAALGEVGVTDVAAEIAVHKSTAFRLLGALEGGGLVEQTGHRETVNVAVLRDHYAVNVDQARGPSQVATHNWIGQLTPLHCTSSGKVLLAHLDPTTRTDLLARAGTPRVTPHTETAAGRLEEQLARVRETGYATAVEEYEVGLNAVAAPVFDRSGQVIAAVSVSGPSYRLDEQRIRHVVGPLLASTAEISRRMGHRRPPP